MALLQPGRANLFGDSFTYLLTRTHRKLPDKSPTLVRSDKHQDHGLHLDTPVHLNPPQSHI